MLKDAFIDMMTDIVDFMHTHSDPYFNLPFLSLAVGLGVVEVITDYFTKE